MSTREPGLPDKRKSRTRLAWCWKRAQSSYWGWPTIDCNEPSTRWQNSKSYIGSPSGVSMNGISSSALEVIPQAAQCLVPAMSTTTHPWLVHKMREKREPCSGGGHLRMKLCCERSLVFANNYAWRQDGRRCSKDDLGLGGE